MSFLKLCTLLTAFALLLTACTSGPEVTSISKDPEVEQVPRSLLVLAIGANEDRRLMMEQALVDRLRSEDFSAKAYGPAPSLAWQDPEMLRKQVRQRVAEQGAEGVLTVSLVRKNRQVEYVPNQLVFSPVTSNLGALASVTYMQALTISSKIEETTEYILRTTLFDISSGKAIWQMFSSTVNPKSTEQAVNEFSRIAVKQLSRSFD